MGGIIPHALRWMAAGIANVATDLPVPHWGFVLSVVGYVVLGGIANMALEGHIKWHALYHGATAPMWLAFLSDSAAKAGHH